MTDPITEITVEVIRQLPIKEAYGDAAAPALRQVGGAAENIAKTLRLALLPLEAASAYYDRVSAALNEAIRKVPEERRVEPAPQILGPVV